MLLNFQKVFNLTNSVFFAPLFDQIVCETRMNFGIRENAFSLFSNFVIQSNSKNDAKRFCFSELFLQTPKRISSLRVLILALEVYRLRFRARIARQVRIRRARLKGFERALTSARGDIICSPECVCIIHTHLANFRVRYSHKIDSVAAPIGAKRRNSWSFVRNLHKTEQHIVRICWFKPSACAHSGCLTLCISGVGTAANLRQPSPAMTTRYGMNANRHDASLWCAGEFLLQRERTLWNSSLH